MKHDLAIVVRETGEVYHSSDLGAAELLTAHSPEEILSALAKAGPAATARFARDLMDWKRGFYEPFMRALTGADGLLYAELDRGASMTQRYGDIEVSGESAAAASEAEELDVKTYVAAVEKLIRQGHLDPSVRDEAYEKLVTYKASRVVANRLRKRGGEVGAAIEKCFVRAPRERKAVTLKWK